MLLKPGLTRHARAVPGMHMLLLLVGYYGCFFSLLSADYMPVWSDEFFYFLNARSFFENHTLRASLSCTGRGSRLFGADAHGFAYSLLHGGLATITGWRSSNFQWLNILFILSALVVLFFQSQFTLYRKVWMSISILLFPAVPLYPFTFMQECLHMLIAILAGVILFHLHARCNNRNFIILFLLLILAGSLFLSTWLLWLIGLIPLAKTKKQRWFFILLFSFGIAGIPAASVWLTEPVTNIFYSFLNLCRRGDFREAAVLLTGNCLANIKSFFLTSGGSFIYAVSRLILVALIVFTLIRAVQTRSALLFAVLLIAGCNLFLFFIFYYATGWRDIRILGGLFFLMIPPILADKTGPFQIGLMAVLLLAFCACIPVTRDYTDRRERAASGLTGKKMIAFQQLANLVDSGQPVLLDYIPADYSADLLVLPLKNNRNDQIRYIVPYYKLSKGSYGYILTRKGKNLPDA